MLIKTLKRIIKKKSIDLNTIQSTVLEYIRFFYKDIEIPFNLQELIYDSEDTYRLELKEIFNSLPPGEIIYLPGEIYKNLIPTNLKKKLGQVFTPCDTIKKIVDDVPIKDMYLSNPYMKVLDPACGSGDFLIEVFRTIIEIIEQNHANLAESFGLDIDNAASHIIKNNLFGCEIDHFTAFLALTNLAIVSRCVDVPNIQIRDYLFSDMNQAFDLVVGNPPYIGHKNLSLSYKKALKEKYHVYSDKADVSYCFFEKCYSDLKEKGILCFITSRYFLEAEYAKHLRDFIVRHYSIIGITDYSGLNLFKNVGISPLIITLSKGIEQKDIRVVNLNANKSYEISEDAFNSNHWNINDNQTRAIIDKFNAIADVLIEEVFNINQGIITGCDKAFIVDESTIIRNKLEKHVLVGWIKSSDLKGNDGIADQKSLKLIYTNHRKMEEIPNTIKYLEQYKDTLEKRRECVSGIRRWFDLQWSREKTLFENDKILFPYKASRNQFTLDTRKYYFSADVYMMTAKEEGKKLYNTLFFLNSDLFEFMIKSSAKKIGSNLFEYYPYLINKMPFIDIPEKIIESKQDYDKIMIQVNQYLYDYLEIDRTERMIVNESIKWRKKEGK